MSRITSALTALPLLSLALLGCASAPPPVPTYAPRFAFSYPPGESPASDVTIAIVKPMDVTSLPAGATVAAATTTRARHQSAFKDGIVAQLQDLFSKKGFKQTGPFDDLNTMTFVDKKGSDLTLTTQLGISLYVPETVPVFEQGFGDQVMGTGVQLVQSKGKCGSSGSISFVILEPLSGEKMWIKKVDLPPAEVECSGKGTRESFTVIDNGVAQLLEMAFQQTMKKVWDYLSPEEMTILKKQSQELRAKKVY
jgi:hypothetical protein